VFGSKNQTGTGRNDSTLGKGTRQKLRGNRTEWRVCEAGRRAVWRI